ncbi:MAG TPA: glycerol kinase GlpK [Myxococcota bacterium]|nr:glycerol kinase GlpK [Myxococcota bacterium]HOD06622.1 glycerol kinase GlpK [Myxococcota bacterium]HPB50861.1 glycerol kinase GlpK [Myxococcota bacterium]HQP95923.1 glycerol kinase GlpK [Myxococcota bacterium]
MAKFILALDEGTTGSTAVVVAQDLTFMAKAANEFRQIFPKPGWVEHDPEEIWAATVLSARQALEKAGVDPNDCAAIAITNQRETSVIWDRDTGKPRFNAIVWQCRRTTAFCEKAKEEGLEQYFRHRTGLVLDPYFSGTKVRWMLDNVPGLRADAEAGKCAFGTIDTWLIHKLTGGVSHVTDPSNASRTLLFNIERLQFDDALLGVLKIPRSLMPEVRPSAGSFGVTKGLDFLPDGIPITGVCGDQQSALFGQTCFDAGQSKCTYGTGAFLLMNTGEKMVPSTHGLLTSVGWTVNGKTSYVLEGSSFIAGAAVQWLRDSLGFIKTAPEVEELAASVPDSAGVVFVPALAGLGAPYWDPEARGGLFGLTRGATRAHISRAVLEGIALQIAELLDAMAKDLGRPLTELRVDGGASANNLMMQFQADILDVPVIRPRNIETTALGAAMLAGIGIGMWDVPRLRELAALDHRFGPQFVQEERDAYLNRYKSAVRCVCGHSC